MPNLLRVCIKLSCHVKFCQVIQSIKVDIGNRHNRAQNKFILVSINYFIIKLLFSYGVRFLRYLFLNNTNEIATKQILLFMISVETSSNLLPCYHSSWSKCRQRTDNRIKTGSICSVYLSRHQMRVDITLVHCVYT